jgi:hypothetical protein
MGASDYRGRIPSNNAATSCSAIDTATGRISSRSRLMTGDKAWDCVIRGIDLITSTGRQIRLGCLLGRERPPTFFHHPLILKTPDQKLSKSDGDTGVRDLRAKGWSPADVIGAARRFQNIDA